MWIIKRGALAALTIAGCALLCAQRGEAGKIKYTSSLGGTFSSADAACRSMVSTPNYTYSHVQKRDNGVYWCFQKPKEGKGEPDYVGVVSAEAEPDAPPADLGGADAASPVDAGPAPCSPATVRGLFPALPAGALATALQGQVADYGCGHCGAESVRLGVRVFSRSPAAERLRLNRHGTRQRTPNHLHLRQQDLYIDSAMLQFFNVQQDSAGPIFVGSAAQLRQLLERLLTTCGLSRRCQVPAARSGDELFQLLYGGAVEFCNGANLTMRPSGQNADWNGCGN